MMIIKPTFRFLLFTLVILLPWSCEEGAVKWPWVNTEVEGVIGGIPAGMVAFLNCDTCTVCPSGWKVADYATGRLLMATVDPTMVLQTGGTPIIGDEGPGHDHTYTLEINVPEKAGCDLNDVNGFAYNGIYQTSGTSAHAADPYPYIQLLACEKLADSTAAQSGFDGLPFPTIALFNLEQCPGANWAPLPGSSAKFLLPLPPNMAVGDTSTRWSNPSEAAHIHQVGFTIPTGELLSSWGCSTKDFAAPQSQIYAIGSTDSVYYTVPFVNLLACQKQYSGPDEKFEPGVTIFYGMNGCPNNWTRVTNASGRFLIGLPENGTPGENFWIYSNVQR